MEKPKKELFMFANPLGINKPGDEVYIVAKLRHHPDDNGHSHVVAYLAMDDTNYESYFARDDGKKAIGIMHYSLEEDKLWLRFPCRKNGCKEEFALILGREEVIYMMGTVEPLEIPEARPWYKVDFCKNYANIKEELRIP